MRRLLVTLLLVCCFPAIATVPGDASTDGPVHPTVQSAYPNPVADGDAGEFVVVSLPAGTNTSEYALTDGETKVALANTAPGNSVAVANDPRASNLTDRPVVVASSLSLGNAGERIRIERNGTAVHERRYRDAPEGQVASWNASRISWRPIGATDRPVVHGGTARVRAFVLPDAPNVPVGELSGAERRILLAGYTLTSNRVAEVLVRARERNLTVEVLLEGEPVGGRTRREARLLDRLVRAGVDVRLVDGPHARYSYHHAKYAVVDDRAVVLTENWKPSGTGGNSSRGWGVVTRQPAIVSGLAETFHADADWRDAKGWETVRRGRRFERGERSVGEYPVRFEPESVRVERTDLLVAPDNAQERLVRTLDRANGSIDVVQVTLGDWRAPLVTALRRAAQRGVTVRILLSDAWYVREDNRALAQRFDEWARDSDASLAVRLADPGDGYEKIHAKGAVVDDRVVLGSLNWNEQAATTNREVVLVLHGESVADYYGRVFERDWGGTGPRLPVGLLGAVAGCLAIAGLVVRRLEFER